MASSLPTSPDISAKDDIDDTSKILLSKLKGQHVVIPSLPIFFSDWPHHVNPEYPKLKATVEAKLATVLDSQYLMDKVQDADPALLVSMFWPHATYQKLRVLCYLVIWQGIFDDLVEEDDVVPGQNQTLRRNMKMFINKSLGLEQSQNASLPAEFEDLTLAKHFAVLAQRVWTEYNEDQRRRLRDALHQYIDATGEERAMIDAEDAPEWLEYAELRARVGGIGPQIAMVEFAIGGRLPDVFIESEEYKTACKALNDIVSLTNDLISFKKEIQSGFLLSAIPILHNSLAAGSINTAITHITAHIKDATASLEQAIDVLETRHGGSVIVEEILAREKIEMKKEANGTGEGEGSDTDSEMGDELVVDRALLNFKYMVTGSLFWSLQCKRYGMAEHMAQDGSLHFTLE